MLRQHHYIIGLTCLTSSKTERIVSFYQRFTQHAFKVKTRFSMKLNFLNWVKTNWSIKVIEEMWAKCFSWIDLSERISFHHPRRADTWEVAKCATRCLPIVWKVQTTLTISPLEPNHFCDLLLLLNSKFLRNKKCEISLKRVFTFIYIMIWPFVRYIEICMQGNALIPIEI